MCNSSKDVILKNGPEAIYITATPNRRATQASLNKSLGDGIKENIKEHQKASFEESLTAQGLILDILRKLFLQEPDRDFLKGCVQHNVFNAVSNLVDNDEAVYGARLISEYFLSCDPINNTEDYFALHWDYTKMFIGPMSPTAPLWASYYLEPERLLFQGTTLYVRQFYRKYGFCVAGNRNSEAEDHLGLEIDFLYQLNSRLLSLLQAYVIDQAKSSTQNQQYLVPSESMTSTAAEFNEFNEFKSIIIAQSRFIKEHMLKFVPKFTQLVDKNTQTGFYAGLAHLLSGFLQGLSQEDFVAT
ncbi:MAG: molecular chaperone TorD family protein [Coriobacteriales bacterium]|jgi:TorA maturation chaperone TorD|nr:molecular chaperone TorD family protein [Coriobacteriales bacterium]